ncbi:MAG: biotin transporter BioY [Stackebrandtia sp.]
MSSPTATVAPRMVLADLIPSAKVNSVTRDAILVASGSALTGASAQVAVTIPAISPVPFVLTTLTVLLLGAAYGPVRAAASMGIYLLAGLAGVPWFSEGTSGTGDSFGYIIGYVAAVALVGALAKRGGDRTILRTSGLMIAGSLVIYAFGVPYLMFATGMGMTDGVMAGMVPFIVGDLIKLVIAAALLPSAWALVAKFRS